MKALSLPSAQIGDGAAHGIAQLERAFGHRAGVDVVGPDFLDRLLGHDIGEAQHAALERAGIGQRADDTLRPRGELAPAALAIGRPFEAP
jgi:hypothetical protein